MKKRPVSLAANGATHRPNGPLPHRPVCAARKQGLFMVPQIGFQTKEAPATRNGTSVLAPIVALTLLTGA